MTMDKVRRVAILGGARIPFCRSNSAYATLGNKDMLGAALAALIDAFGLAGERLGEVAAGAVLKHARDWNLTREVVLGSKLSPQTPAYDVQQACGTSLETVIHVGNKIALGEIEAGIAGGVDTTSDAPISLDDDLRRVLLEAGRARSLQARMKVLLKLRPRHLIPEFPGVVEPRTGLSMGEHTELMAKEWHIPRADQDRLACESHHKAARAWDEGFYSGLVTPYQGIERDNNIRPDTSLDKLAGLKPAFDKTAGTLTAGNSTPLTDGAATVLLASEEWAQAHGLPVQAYLSHAKTAAVDFVSGRDGLLMAPAYAVPRMLDRAGLTLQDFDFYEIHEAFAAQVLCTLHAWQSATFCKDRLGRDAPLGEIDDTRLNVKGGSIAIGHPFAATGARIVAGLAKLLAETEGSRGLISICAAGGMGVTAILEGPRGAR